MDRRGRPGNAGTLRIGLAGLLNDFGSLSERKAVVMRIKKMSRRELLNAILKLRTDALQQMFKEQSDGPKT